MILSRMPEHQKLEPGQCRPCRNRSKGWFLCFVVFRWEWSSRSISGEPEVLLTIITCGGCRSESSVWTLDLVILLPPWTFNLNVCNFNFRLYASRDNSQLSCKSNTWRSTSTLLAHGSECALISSPTRPALNFCHKRRSSISYITSNQLCH